MPMNGESVFSRIAARDLTRTGRGVTIFLGVGSNAVPVFVVDAKILDGLALELVAHAGWTDCARRMSRSSLSEERPIASASERASGAYSSIARRASWPSLGTVSAVKSCAPPYTV